MYQKKNKTKKICIRKKIIKKTICLHSEHCASTIKNKLHYLTLFYLLEVNH